MSAHAETVGATRTSLRKKKCPVRAEPRRLGSFLAATARSLTVLSGSAPRRGVCACELSGEAEDEAHFLASYAVAVREARAKGPEHVAEARKKEERMRLEEGFEINVLLFRMFESRSRRSSRKRLTALQKAMFARLDALFAIEDRFDAADDALEACARGPCRASTRRGVQAPEPRVVDAPARAEEFRMTPASWTCSRGGSAIQRASSEMR